MNQQHNGDHDKKTVSATPDTLSASGVYPSMTALEREHELTKMAKDLAVGLPIREDSARAIAARIGHHPLAMAAFSSWIEALQEAIEDSIAGVAFGSSHGNVNSMIVHTLRDRLKELNQQAEQITSRLANGGSSSERSISGASARDRTQDRTGDPMQEGSPR
jgi:hypothetical protein